MRDLSTGIRNPLAVRIPVAFSGVEAEARLPPLRNEPCAIRLAVRALPWRLRVRRGEARAAPQTTKT